MLEQDDHIGFGFSGGKDSTVLLYILHKLKKKYSNFKITALTVDEGIDGYRDESIEITKRFTEKYNIDRLIYYEETDDVTLAIEREKEIKGWTRKKKIALMKEMNPEFKDLSEGWFD